MNKFTFMRSIALGSGLVFGVVNANAQFGFTNSNSRLTPTTMRSGNCITVVDVNNDGLDDIVRMDDSRDLWVDLQQRNGNFTSYNVGNVSGSNVWGMAVADFDHNGWKDVVTGPNGSVYLAKLSWNGSAVVKTQSTLSNSNFFTQNITCGDFNNDGWDDVYVCDDNAYAKVYMNDGAGNLQFLAHSTTSMTIGTGSKSFTIQTGLAFTVGQTVKVGYDGTKYMTGTVTSYNSGTGAMVVNVTSVVGSGTFPTWSVHSNIVFNHQLSTTTYGGDPADSGNYGSAWVDFDNDGDLDFYVAHCRQASTSVTDLRRKDRLFVNDGNGNFTDMASAHGIEAGDYNQTWTGSFGDIDNDGDFDLLVTNHDIASQIFENDGTGNYTDITPTTGFSTTGAGTQPIESYFEDFDNDGFVDIFVTGSNFVLYKNNGNKTFSLVGNAGMSQTGGMVSFAVGDLNHDGFSDIFASYGDIYNSPSASTNDVLYLNNKNANHFITFALTGTVSNHDAIGARVTIFGAFGTQIREVRAGESYGTVNSFNLHFGLGANTTIDSARIDWPSGNTTNFGSLNADQFVSVVEGTCSITNNTIPGPYNLCTGQSLTLTANGGFASYNWNTGATTQSVTTSTTGNFNVMVTNGACSNVSPSVSVQLNPDETPSVTQSGSNSCQGTITLTSSTAAGYTWSGPGGFTSTSQSINPPVSGNYSVTIQGFCATFTSPAYNAVVSAAPAPTGVDQSSPTPTSFNLNATGTNSSNISWYDQATGGTLLGTGANYTTPVISTTTNYFVEESFTYASAPQTTGQLYHTGASNYNTSLNGGVDFTVIAPCTLNTVKVYSSTAGARKILLKNSVGANIDSVIVNIPIDTSVVTLNLALTPGTGYRLTTDQTTNQTNFGGISPALRRSQSGAAYPYSLSGLINITNGWTGSASTTNAYYYFYDWKVQGAPMTCISDRDTVTAAINTATGIDNASLNNAIAIYPNPANASVNVKFESALAAGAQINITDIAGRVILANNVQNVNQGQIVSLNIENINAGTYFITVRSENKNTVQKLIITK
ncbi:MAG: VCBS repeat-containing protein [Bacteroidia bacterium]|nr:VCBS repeat-containing protein [Bacteroidia bacterium]